jgi:hypothetical protein
MSSRFIQAVACDRTSVLRLNNIPLCVGHVFFISSTNGHGLLLLFGLVFKLFVPIFWKLPIEMVITFTLVFLFWRYRDRNELQEQRRKGACSIESSSHKNNQPLSKLTYIFSSQRGWTTFTCSQVFKKKRNTSHYLAGKRVERKPIWIREHTEL